MKKVLVVGGGLAGLIAARQLQKHGFQVTVLEASQRWGGKAGADFTSGRMWEHGYHIFPAWYRNIRKILGELNIPLIDFDRWHYLERKNGQAKYVTTRVPSGFVDLYKSLRDGLLPMADAILYWYFVLDMLSEPLSNKHILDQVSRLGMMRGRWYMTEHIPEMEKENVLKASAIPVYELSAMTAKKISAYWVKSPLPFLSILPGDLQTTFVDPIVSWVAAAGVELKLGHKVTQVSSAGGRVQSMRVEDLSSGTTSDVTADIFLITTPLEVTRRLINFELQKLDHELGNFEHLEAAPMAALTLALNHRRSDLPKEHVFFREGRYGLSFIDLTPHWPGQVNTMITFISSNFIPIRDLTPAEQYDALMEEIHQYLGITAADVADYKLNPNTETPLFINTIGAWPNRARVKAKNVENLYFAGDWVKNGIDLACMEGAVASALDAARTIGDREGAPTIPGPLTPKTYKPWMLRAAKWALAPAMIPVHLWSRFDRR